MRRSTILGTQSDSGGVGGYEEVSFGWRDYWNRSGNLASPTAGQSVATSSRRCDNRSGLALSAKSAGPGWVGAGSNRQGNAGVQDMLAVYRGYPVRTWC